ncbi:NAD(P)-dependent oxidoreductase [Kibdelosporangium philippinense]|nr:NAD(P)-dependent oxidoreductase [Kibdelosporangium philippinense]
MSDGFHQRRARMASVGVVGVGRIGAPLVARLVAAGHDVVATDIRPECRALVEESGAQWAPDATKVTAKVVFTVMPGNQELHDLAGDLLSHMDEGSVWIDLTSASLELGEECARAARENGVAYLDAPIGGGVAAMQEGTVTLYVGGDPAVLEANTPVLTSFAKAVHHAGASGMGYLTKLLINLLWFGHATLTTEVLLLAQRHGQSPDRMRHLLRGSAGDSAYVQHHLPALLQGDYLRDFGLDRCVEELDSIERTASQARTPHPLTSVIAELHRAALDRYGPVDGELMASALLEEQAQLFLRPVRPE